MPIHLQFSFTLDDYIAGQLLHAKSSWWLRLNSILARWVLPAIGVLNIALAIWLARIDLNWVVFSFLLAIGLFLTFYRMYYRFRLKRCYRRSRVKGSDERTVEFSDSNILIRQSNAKSELEWSAVRSFLEDRNTFLLYLAANTMIMVPKRVCTEIQIGELREMCRRNISAVPA